MANAKHTPLPWRLEDRCVAFGDPERFGRYIKLYSPWVEDAWDDDAEAAANAAFIVRACNSHYDLLEALKETIAQFEPYVADEGDKDIKERNEAWIAQVRALVAKAEDQ